MIFIDVKKTGEKIHGKARDMKLKADDIAEALETDVTAVYAWYAGKNLPKLANLFNLAQIFGCSVDELVVTGLEE